jgi:hypothetical protein
MFPFDRQLDASRSREAKLAYSPVRAFRRPFLNESFIGERMKFFWGVNGPKIFRSIAGLTIASTLRAISGHLLQLLSLEYLGLTM